MWCAIDPDEIFWFALEHGAWSSSQLESTGCTARPCFPASGLIPGALLSGNRHKLRSVVDLGCATPEHAAFVARLAAHPSHLRRAAGIRPRSMIGLWESPGPNPMTPRRNGSAGHRRLLTNLSVLPVRLKHYSRVGFAALTRESMTEFNFCLLTVPKNLWRMMPRESRM